MPERPSGTHAKQQPRIVARETQQHQSADNAITIQTGGISTSATTDQTIAAIVTNALAINE